MILKNLIGRSFENPATPLSDPDNWLIETLGGGRSAAGVVVNSSTALEYPAIWKGVNLISRDVGKLPLFIYRRLPEGGKERANTHPAYRLLRHKPNPFQTAVDFKATLQAQALLWGNGYAFIDRAKTGAAGQLLPLDAAITWPVRRGGLVWYRTVVDDQQVALMATDVFHVKGLPDGSSGGLAGLSVLAKARESVGLGLAAREYQARFFSNDASPRAVLEHPGKLTDGARDHLRESWEKIHKGLSNKHRLAVLEEGMKLNPYSVSPADAELLKTREFEIRDVANWIGAPAHKLGDPTKTSFASLEQENQSYLDDALDPWLAKWEAEAWDKLLTERQKMADSHVVEFLRAALVRGDLAARTAAYSSALQAGWMNRDEVRDRENLNPIPEGEGSKFWQPSNVVLVGEEPEPPPPPPVPPALGPGAAPQDDDDDPQADDDDQADARAALVADAAGRILRRLTTSAKRAARRSDGGLQTWIAEQLRPKHRAAALAILGPVVRACGLQAGLVDRGVDSLLDATAAVLGGLGANPDPDVLGPVLEQLITDTETTIRAAADSWPPP
jgi:HK97 family phage portal protein